MNACITEPVVSANWLHNNLEAKNLVILNATIPKVVGSTNDGINSKIPNSKFFDIKKKFSDTNGRFPNTFPSLDQFNREVQALGINNDSCIIVYDELGIYSSARAWWLFKAFSHDNVAVLDGGFLDWNKQKFITQLKTEHTVETLGNFQGIYNEGMMCFFDDITSLAGDDDAVILDARSSKRFSGIIPEPREGLRSGTIPNSRNLPYNELIENGKLKSKKELKELFSKLAKHGDQLFFSCGSGITACVLALAATYINYNKCCVYDGSWTEYGSLTTNL